MGGRLDMKIPRRYCEEFHPFVVVGAGVPLGVELFMESCCGLVDLSLSVDDCLAVIGDLEILFEKLLQLVLQMAAGRVIKFNVQLDCIDSSHVLITDLKFDVIDAFRASRTDERCHNNLEALVWNVISIRKVRQDDKARRIHSVRIVSHCDAPFCRRTRSNCASVCTWKL